jgi:hypothetical protein
VPSPCSPRDSPWSEVRTTIVLSESPRSSSRSAAAQRRIHVSDLTFVEARLLVAAGKTGGGCTAGGDRKSAGKQEGLGPRFVEPGEPAQNRLPLRSRAYSPWWSRTGRNRYRSPVRFQTANPSQRRQQATGPVTCVPKQGSQSGDLLGKVKTHVVVNEVTKGVTPVNRDACAGNVVGAEVDLLEEHPRRRVDRCGVSPQSRFRSKKGCQLGVSMLISTRLSGPRAETPPVARSETASRRSPCESKAVTTMIRTKRPSLGARSFSGFRGSCFFLCRPLKYHASR